MLYMHQIKKKDGKLLLVELEDLNPYLSVLELDEETTLKLLEKAGYTLSNSIKKDIVIRYFIRKKEFDIISINNALYDLNLDLIKC